VYAYYLWDADAEGIYPNRAINRFKQGLVDAFEENPDLFNVMDYHPSPVTGWNPLRNTFECYQASFIKLTLKELNPFVKREQSLERLF